MISWHNRRWYFWLARESLNRHPQDQSKLASKLVLLLSLSSSWSLIHLYLGPEQAVADGGHCFIIIDLLFIYCVENIVSEGRIFHCSLSGVSGLLCRVHYMIYMRKICGLKASFMHFRHRKYWQCWCLDFLRKATSVPSGIVSRVHWPNRGFCLLDLVVYRLLKWANSWQTCVCNCMLEWQMLRVGWHRLFRVTITNSGFF